MDPATVLMSVSRFTAAMARLSLGPLLPLISLDMDIPIDAKAALLSSFSWGYILTQIVGGYIAERCRPNYVLSVIAFASGCILLALVRETNHERWIEYYFVLGCINGPLFPTSYVIISSSVAPSKRSGAAAIIDAAASAGTCAATYAPALASSSLLLHYFFFSRSSNSSTSTSSSNWKGVFVIIACASKLVAVAALLFNDRTKKKTDRKNVTMKEKLMTTTTKTNTTHFSSSSSQEEEEEESITPTTISSSGSITYPKKRRNSKDVSIVDNHNDANNAVTNNSSTNASTTTTKTDTTTTTNIDYNNSKPSIVSKIKAFLTGNNNDNNNNNNNINSVILSSSAASLYMCHCCDNFCKYILNAWLATMFVEKFHATPTYVGTRLALQEAVGVIAKVLFGVKDPINNIANQNANATTNHPTEYRSLFSAIVFLCQGMLLYVAFRTHQLQTCCNCLLGFAFLSGGHFIGYRPCYFELTNTPEQSGILSGYGNTIASVASAFGPILVGKTLSSSTSTIGTTTNDDGDDDATATTTSIIATWWMSLSQWERVAFLMMLVNVLGVISSVGLKKKYGTRDHHHITNNSNENISCGTMVSKSNGKDDEKHKEKI